MTELIFELLLRFLWGSLTLLTLVSRSETSERFLRIAAYIAAGVSAVLLILLQSSGPSEIKTVMYLSISALLTGMALYTFCVSRFFRISGFMLLVLSPCFFLIGRGWLDSINFILASGVLGSIFLGQYLGHWYLTVANLKIFELQKVLRLIYLFIFLKSTEVSITLLNEFLNPSHYTVDEMGRPATSVSLETLKSIEQLNAGTSLFSYRGDYLLGLGIFGVLLLITRILWGILAPGFLMVLVKKCVDKRQTQSATGILYAMCVMIILGEGAAIFLKSVLGWNL